MRSIWNIIIFAQQLAHWLLWASVRIAIAGAALYLILKLVMR